jgi:hypothetical protein
MAILRNIDVSKKIGVSPATVKNWIEYSLIGKANLDLTKIGPKHYIEDSVENIDKMYKLKNQGVKYRSKTEWITVEPDEKLYDIFSEDQLVDLMNNIMFHKYIPMKYSYTKQGVEAYFNAVTEELKNIKDQSQNIVATESQRLNTYLMEITDRYAKKGKKINLIEVGHDYQTYCLKETLKNLLEGDSIKSYISISTSPDMHKIREKTIKDVFKLPQINFKAYTRDIEKVSIADILDEAKDGDDSVNIILLLRATISNYLNPQVILSRLYESMYFNDYVALSTTLTDETKKDRVEREVNMSSQRAKRYDWLLKTMNLYKYVDMISYSYDLSTAERHRSCTTNSYLNFTLDIKGKKRTYEISRDFRIDYLYSKRFTLVELQELLSQYFEIHQFNTINKEQIGFAFMSPRL